MRILDRGMVIIGRPARGRRRGFGQQSKTLAYRGICTWVANLFGRSSHMRPFLGVPKMGFWGVDGRNFDVANSAQQNTSVYRVPRPYAHLGAPTARQRAFSSSAFFLFLAKGAQLF